MNTLVSETSKTCGLHSIIRFNYTKVTVNYFTKSLNEMNVLWSDVHSKISLLHVFKKFEGFLYDRSKQFKNHDTFTHSFL